MRSGNIVAIAVLIAVIIGGLIWYNGRGNQPEIASEPTPQPSDPVGESGTVQTQDTGPVTQDDETGDAPIIVGDEITDDTIVVESATVDAVILDPDSADSSVETVDDETLAAPANAASDEGPENDSASPLTADQPSSPTTNEVGQAPAEAETETDPAGTETAATGIATPDPADLEAAELLTPQNFDRDGVLMLLAGSDQLNDEERSSLGALVAGAVANPEMQDGAIALIRLKLGLQPVE